MASLLGCLLLALAGLPVAAAPERVPLYTAYLDAPLDASSPGNLTAELAAWLSRRSAGRYQFVATSLARGPLDALIAKPGWNGAVVWANPRWFDDLDRQRFLWTEAFMQDSDIVVSLRRQPIDYLDEGRSLENFVVAVERGHRVADVEWLIAAGRLRRIDVTQAVDGLVELRDGRVDAVFVQAISLPHFRRQLPELDSWLYVAPQPRDTFGRHAFTARGNASLRNFLAAQLSVLSQDPAWRGRLPSPPRQLKLVGVDIMGSHYSQALRRTLDLAFERSGLRYALSSLPAERAVVDLRTARADGDMARGASYDRTVHGALRVEPAHSSILLLALARPGVAVPARVADMSSMRVAVPRGFKQQEELTRGLPGREIVEGLATCVRMVSQGRVDVCLMPGYSATDWPGRQAKGPQLVAHVMDSFDVHLWLRPGLEAEARQLSAALQALQRSGELARLMGEFRYKAGH
ncbi:transporter substrate-binding domain-containing protein [Pelomonas sp. SE-A7]|uniref:transporter substrate-binding domain-containing protein n=1 Tax=Pelomonas sp. SE-A7 TaxID=3054953 RepID=UPI00259D07E3|nr:transporter substrate-binding domain-containing protein [Pelomonas sp. SE-A7]MDM4766559.1 hypothetical protein [Pelomonas sp. SE-A7]